VIAGVQPIVERATGAGADVTDLAGAIRERFAHFRPLNTLLGAFGGLSVLLAMTGIFGIVSFGISQRRKETAIRLSVGATDRDVLQMIVGQGLKPVPIGIAAGLLLAWGLIKLASSVQLLPGALNLGDPIPYLAVTLLLVTINLAAILLSARRALGAHALSPLREE
jgi:ABC-type antimicrobial peptide transport system permease subunit